MKKMHEIFPNGCSSKQLEAFRSSWFKDYGNPFTENIEWPREVKVLEEMYSALEMLSSCFAYGGTKKFYKQYYDEYLEDYLKVGGTKEDFDKMLTNQCEHYKKCFVEFAGTDFEGCSYNYIIENDEEIA